MFLTQDSFCTARSPASKTVENIPTSLAFESASAFRCPILGRVSSADDISPSNVDTRAAFLLQSRAISGPRILGGVFQAYLHLNILHKLHGLRCILKDLHYAWNPPLLLVTAGGCKKLTSSPIKKVGLSLP